MGLLLVSFQYHLKGVHHLETSPYVLQVDPPVLWLVRLRNCHTKLFGSLALSLHTANANSPWTGWAKSNIGAIEVSTCSNISSRILFKSISAATLRLPFSEPSKRRRQTMARPGCSSYPEPCHSCQVTWLRIRRLDAHPFLRQDWRPCALRRLSAECHLSEGSVGSVGIVGSRHFHAREPQAKENVSFWGAIQRSAHVPKLLRSPTRKSA